MNRFIRWHNSGLALLASLLLAPMSFAASYTVTDLGVLGDPYKSSTGTGVNLNGQVVGQLYYQTDPGPLLIATQYHSRAFLYDGTMHDLGTLGGNNSVASGINSNGVVVGHSQTATGAAHAYLYDSTMHDLGTLGGTESYAGGINASNQVAGTSDTPDGFQRAFLYDGSMHDLGTLGGRNSYGGGINDSGLVVGASEIYPLGDTTHAFLYDGTMHDLGTLGGDWSRGNAINALGHVAGSANTVSSFHGFFYDGVMHDIGDLGGGYSEALAINASDEITGGAGTADGGYHAFLYTPQGGMLDLNSLIEPSSGWNLFAGWGINDAGQVTGLGFIGGEAHAFLLSPVPEPAGFVLVSIAALGLLSTLRRAR